MLQKKPLHVAVAPLNWGLGHATRCIPLIETMMDMGVQVTIIGWGESAALLKKLFPTVHHVNSPGFTITYGRNKVEGIIKLARIVVGLNNLIKKEKKWLANWLTKNNIDALISDNRYGLHNSAIPCVFMTHQLAVQTGLGGFVNNLVQKLLYKHINQFSNCWVVDTEKPPGLSGLLGHPNKMPNIPSAYLGVLTRFSKLELPIVPNSIAVISSGPEPQRSILLNTLISQAAKLPQYNFTIFGHANVESLPKHITVIPNASTAEINRICNQAELLISRSGYTTVMDMMYLGKKCIVVPTPLQQEQQYLGHHLAKNGWVTCVKQDEIDLKTIIEKVKATNMQPVFSFNKDEYKEPLAEFLNKLQ
jgi:UDP:flavonoid glycosyltransferase YjiC (YdhE family)